MLIDVIMALIVFVGALGAFLAVARDNSDRIEDSSRRVRADDIAHSVLASLEGLPQAELRDMASSSSERDFPGGLGVLEVAVEPSEIDGVLAVSVSFRYRATDGHERTARAIGLHAVHGLRMEGER
jgi:hypothetical protein